MAESFAAGGYVQLNDEEFTARLQSLSQQEEKRREKVLKKKQRSSSSSGKQIPSERSILRWTPVPVDSRRLLLGAKDGGFVGLDELPGTAARVIIGKSSSGRDDDDDDEPEEEFRDDEEEDGGFGKSGDSETNQRRRQKKAKNKKPKEKSTETTVPTTKKKERKRKAAAMQPTTVTENADEEKEGQNEEEEGNDDVEQERAPPEDVEDERMMGTEEHEHEQVEVEPEEDEKHQQHENKKKEKKKKKKKKAKGNTVPTTEEKPATAVDVRAWHDYGLGEELLRGLSAAGFEAPTEVQRRMLLAGLIGRKDILCASETGSGKTLAYGLPVLQQICEHYSSSAEEARGTLHALVLCPTRELALQVREHLAIVARFTPARVLAVVGGLSAQKQQRLLQRGANIIVATPGRLWELITTRASSELASIRSIGFLVLDEADRMVEQGHYRELDDLLALLPRRSPVPSAAAAAAAVSKGKKRSQQQQEEKKKKKRKKENKQQMIKANKREGEGEEEEAKEEEEEAGEKKRVAEAVGGGVKARQTFVLSATLTASIPQRRESALDQVLSRVEFQRRREVIDLTPREITASRLSESMVACTAEEKDVHLVHFLFQFPGRTIVFVNAISTLRRLLPMLAELGVPAWGLHAQMEQRQRLRNLDRFRKLEHCVLVATDVAARGLDISAVQHVLHYQLPHTAELYVHRSGRTARAMHSGQSVLLVSPEDYSRYLAICRTLNKDAAELPTLQVDARLMPLARKAVRVAKRIDAAVHAVAKESSERRWIEQAAKEFGVDAEDMLPEAGAEDHVKQTRQLQQKQAKTMESTDVTALRKQLAALLQSVSKLSATTTTTNPSAPDAAATV